MGQPVQMSPVMMGQQYPTGYHPAGFAPGMVVQQPQSMVRIFFPTPIPKFCSDLRLVYADASSPTSTLRLASGSLCSSRILTMRSESRFKMPNFSESVLSAYQTNIPEYEVAILCSH